MKECKNIGYQIIHQMMAFVINLIWWYLPRVNWGSEIFASLWFSSLVWFLASREPLDSVLFLLGVYPWGVWGPEDGCT